MDTDLLAYLEADFLTEARRQRFIEVLSRRTKLLTVAIEDVFQLHNTSAIIRSCDAFGIQEVHVVEDRFEDRLDKNIAMGSEQWVDVTRYADAVSCLDALKRKGYRIVATVPYNGSVSLDSFQIDAPTALFFGTEKEGLSAAVLERADAFLTIPMVGFPESLNVSVSAAILIQRLSAQLRDSNLPWQLHPEEILEKRLEWTKKSIKNVEGIIERYHSK
ncbi:RNA methyltransferase [Flagellimonas sp. DF-77]|uniref:TrmH family RNA methyltransferase n=1 Tax=Flagellimonas algarum TaxID=3230298 RepID=UPI003390D73A